MKLRLEQTCGACPEQYDAFTPEGQNIGYLHLRHGYFYAEYTPTSERAYEAYPKGDGIFNSDERAYYLGEACDALINKHLTYKLRAKDTYYFGDESE